MKEQIFFNDPANDKMLGMIMALAAEVYALRDRTRTLEELLARHGIAAREADEMAKLHTAQHLAERDAFIARLMEPWLHETTAARSTSRTLP